MEMEKVILSNLQTIRITTKAIITSSEKIMWINSII